MRVIRFHLLPLTGAVGATWSVMLLPDTSAKIFYGLLAMLMIYMGIDNGPKEPPLGT